MNWQLIKEIIVGSVAAAWIYAAMRSVASAVFITIIQQFFPSFWRKIQSSPWRHR